MSWYAQGIDAVEEALESQKEDIQRAQRPRIREFWMYPKGRGKGGKPDASETGDAEVIVLDESCFTFKRHEIKIGNNWQTHTCIKRVPGEDYGEKGCPLCDSGNKPFDCYPRTVLDLRTITTKVGASPLRKVILPAKYTTHESLRAAELREIKGKPRGPLAGWRIILSRIKKEDTKFGEVSDCVEFIDDIEGFFQDLANEGHKEPIGPEFVPVTDQDIAEGDITIPASEIPITSLYDFRAARLIRAFGVEDIAAALEKGEITEKQFSPDGFVLRVPDKNSEELPLNPWAFDYLAWAQPHAHDELVSLLRGETSESRSQQETTDTVEFGNRAARGRRF